MTLAPSAAIASTVSSRSTPFAVTVGMFTVATTSRATSSGFPTDERFWMTKLCVASAPGTTLLVAEPNELVRSGASGRTSTSSQSSIASVFGTGTMGPSSGV